jgi:hypothetical protein
MNKRETDENEREETTIQFNGVEVEELNQLYP